MSTRFEQKVAWTRDRRDTTDVNQFGVGLADGFLSQTCAKQQLLSCLRLMNRLQSWIEVAHLYILD